MPHYKERRSLVGTITDKANASYGKPVTRANYSEWRNHWINTGKLWRDELAKEGLTETVEKLDLIIRSQSIKNE